MTTVDMEEVVEGEVEEVVTLVAETGTGEGDMGVVVAGMIPEEAEEMTGAAADTVVVAAVVMVGAETIGVVEEDLEVEGIEEEEVAAMVEAETTEGVADLVEVGIEEEVVVDLGEGEVTEEEEEGEEVLGVASEGMMVVVVVGTKKFHRRTRSSCRSKYGIDMVIQSYFALLFYNSSIDNWIIRRNT